MAPVEAYHLQLPLAARWPYSRLFNGCEPGTSFSESLEVVKRTVAPEAQNYFNRILKVTESELQKLLIHKVQNLFDPLSDPHAGDLQRGSNLLKEKPTAEGQHLSAYIVTVLSRIMVDFSRFADLVLRWQLNATDRKCDRKAGPKRPATAHVTFDTGSAHSDVSNPSIDWELHCQPILERLERLDQQNTELEGRYSKVLAELRERTRLFLRERSLFQQRLKMIRSHALKVEDGELLRLLEHDVQFFDDLDDSIQDVKETYEKKLLEQEISFQKIIKDKDFSLTVLKGKMADLEEAAEELKELKERKATDKVGPLQAKLEKAEKMMEEMEGELHSAQEESRRFRSEHKSVLMQLDNLKDALQQKVAEMDSQSAELTAAVGQQQQLREEVDQLQSDLASCRIQLASERRRADEEQKKREMQEMQVARARQERAARLVKQILPAQSVMPDDRLERAQRELSELKEQFNQKEDLLKKVQCDLTELRSAEQRRQEELSSSAAAKDAQLEAAQQGLQEMQQQLEISRAQENRLAKRLQESQDRLRETEAKVQELQSEVDQLQSQLKTQQTEKAQAEAEGKLDAENLRKALEQLEAERAGEEKPRAKSHDRQPIEKHMPSLSENVGSQDGREVTSFLSDEKVLTDQSQQTDPGQLEEPQTNSLAQDVAQLRSEKAQLQQTVQALQEELRQWAEDVARSGAGSASRSGSRGASRPGSKAATAEVTNKSACKFCDTPGTYHDHPDPVNPKDEISRMFDYPRVLTMGGGWLSGVSKRHKVKPVAPTSPLSPRSGSPVELMATRMPSPSPGRSSSPSPMVPLTAKAKRSTVCRSPPREDLCECEARQKLTARAPAAEVAQVAQVVQGAVQGCDWDKAGHPLGIAGGSEPQIGPDAASKAANLASIDMATAAQMHQRLPDKSMLSTPHRRDGDTLRRTFSGHGSISETVPTARVFPRPRSAAALLPGFRGRGTVRRLRPCSATGL